MWVSDAFLITRSLFVPFWRSSVFLYLAKKLLKTTPLCKTSAHSQNTVLGKMLLYIFTPRFTSPTDSLLITFTCPHIYFCTHSLTHRFTSHIHFSTHSPSSTLTLLHRLISPPQIHFSTHSLPRRFTFLHTYTSPQINFSSDSHIQFPTFTSHFHRYLYYSPTKINYQ